MFVIVTGPDLSGKTEMTKQLWEKLEPDVRFKGDRPEDKYDAENKLWDVLIDAVKTERSYICDRLYYPDDIIYTLIFSNGKERSDIIEGQEGGILRLLFHLKAFFIYVTAHPRAILNRLNERGDEHIDESMVYKIDASYKQFFHGFPLPYTKVDTTEYGFQEAYEKAWRDIIYYYTQVIPNNINWKGSNH